jgi:hypothetical protein
VLSFDPEALGGFAGDSKAAALDLELFVGRRVREIAE